jgi:cytochrome c556
MLRSLSIVLLAAVCATAAYAQSAAISQRKESMKAFAGAAKVPDGMLQGETPFDLTKVQASLKVVEEHGAKLKELWPDDSQTGGKTRALPAVWTKKSEFLGRFDRLASDAKAAATAIKDEASFKTEWPKVTEDCAACHRDFRGR